MTTLQLGLLAITAAAPSVVTFVPTTSNTDNLKLFYHVDIHDWKKVLFAFGSVLSLKPYLISSE